MSRSHKMGLLCLIIGSGLVWASNGDLNISVFFFSLFSSPEHEVLMVSFCDRPMSVVRRPQFLHLLLNQWANLDETWQGCSFG